MKKFLNWKTAVLLLSVLAAAVSVFIRDHNESGSDLSLRLHLPEFSGESTEKIVLSWKNSITTLEFRDGTWQVLERGGHPADMEKVGRLIESIQKIRPLRRAVPGDKEMCSLLRVNPEEADPRKIPGVRIRLYDGKGNSLRDLTFGAGYFTVTADAVSGQEPEPSGRWAGIVKEDGSVIPFLISSMFEEFHPVPGGWISCPVFDGLNQLVSINFDSSRYGKWMLARLSVEDPFVSVIPGNQAVSRRNVGALFNVLSQRYIYDGIPEKEAGALQKAGVFTVQGRNGFIRQIEFFTSVKFNDRVFCRVSASAKAGADQEVEKKVQEFQQGRKGWLYVMPVKIFETIRKNPAGE